MGSLIDNRGYWDKMSKWEKRRPSDIDSEASQIHVLLQMSSRISYNPR